MKRRMSKNILHKKRDTPSWFDIINDDHEKLVIPVGPRFQAEIPDFIGPSFDVQLGWLGTKDWPINVHKQEMRTCMIGKGRRKFCRCSVLGSDECVKYHISKKRQQLQSDLGPAFLIWRFDDMGEDIAKQWNNEEQMKFMNLVITNPISEGKFFLNRATKSFPSKSKKDIVSYYLNVYIPRRMSVQTKLGYKNIDTDDDETTETSTTLKSLKKKRYNTERISSEDSKHVQTKYLIRRRKNERDATHGVQKY